MYVELRGCFNVLACAGPVEAQHRLIADIIELAGEVGVEFAFPTRTIHSVPEGATPRAAVE